MALLTWHATQYTHILGEILQYLDTTIDLSSTLATTEVGAGNATASAFAFDAVDVGIFGPTRCAASSSASRFCVTRGAVRQRRRERPHQTVGHVSGCAVVVCLCGGRRFDGNRWRGAGRDARAAAPGVDRRAPRAPLVGRRPVARCISDLDRQQRRHGASSFVRRPNDAHRALQLAMTVTIASSMASGQLLSDLVAADNTTTITVAVAGLPGAATCAHSLFRSS